MTPATPTATAPVSSRPARLMSLLSAAVVALLAAVACAAPEAEGLPTPGGGDDPPRIGDSDIAWSSAAPAPIGVAEAQGGVVGGRLYVFGGYTSWHAGFCATTAAWAFDPVVDTWSAMPDMPLAWTHAAVAVVGTTFYLAGGRQIDGGCAPDDRGVDTVLAFDTTQSSWSATAVPPLPAARSSGGLVHVDGRLHFFGGVANGASGFEGAGEHWAYDLADGGAWQTRAPLPLPRSHFGAVALGGSIYVVGGQVGEQHELVAQTAVHRYDPGSDAWVALAPLPRGVGHITASTMAVGDVIVVVGGERSHNVPVADVLLYHAADDAWITMTPIPSATRSPVAGLLGGAIYVAGGDFSSATRRGVVTTVVE